MGLVSECELVPQSRLNRPQPRKTQSIKSFAQAQSPINRADALSVSGERDLIDDFGLPRTRSLEAMPAQGFLTSEQPNVLCHNCSRQVDSALLDVQKPV
jgi:hypothetical protein